MGFPRLSVRVAFASNPFDDTLVWTEIGPAAAAGPGGAGWVREVTTKRGRERLLRLQSQFQAGTALVKLDNRDRRFDPTNTSGPYSPNVEPEKVVQVGATWAGTFYPIWTGYVDDWTQSWPGFLEGEVPLAATDFFKHLSLTRVLGSFSRQVIADGAGGFWRLDEPAGASLAADASGHQATGVYVGAVTLGGAGPLALEPGTSASFTTPSAGYLTGAVHVPSTVPTWASVATTGWSYETWLQTDVAVPGGFPDYLDGINLWSEDRVYGAGEVGMTFEHNANYAALAVNWNNTNWWNSGVGVPFDGQWHHVAVTATPLAGTITVYLDGVGHVCYRTLGKVPPFVAADFPSGPAGCTLADAFYPFRQADVAVYDHALTAAQVLRHYKAGFLPASWTGDRLNQILDGLGWPASRRRVDTGRTWCAVDSQDETQTKALDLFQRVEQTEQGQCYVDGAGNLVFADRYHRYLPPESVPAATVGDGGAANPTEIPYAMGGVTLGFDRTELYNDIYATRRGGVLQHALNEDSIARYRIRTPTGLSDLLMAADIDALGAAEWILAVTAYPQLQLGALTLDPTADDRLWPLVLGADIGSVINVIKHQVPGGGPPLSVAARIEGVAHSVTPPRGWKTTWNLSVGDIGTWCFFDDPVFGVLDAGNRYGW